ncbi:hypothetical protein EUGRSUZ_G00521 [Eucalyptus grandis]|uniref:Uncharacterized protein n=2 Tax=Eucalyptus grandis TaxID=71139 RepID=A0ACC3K077_EUCGR|nr:hypothetical protein EUGRSUZ_G00521 [Eucalyptus grandis]
MVPMVSPINHSALEVQSSIYLLVAGLSVADRNCCYELAGGSFPSMNAPDLSSVLDMDPFYRGHNPYCSLVRDFFFHLAQGYHDFAEEYNFAEHLAA